jgi:hypothetical protein
MRVPGMRRAGRLDLCSLSARPAIETKNESRVTSAAMNAILANTSEDQRPRLLMKRW